MASRPHLLFSTGISVGTASREFGHTLAAGSAPGLQSHCRKVAISYTNSLKFSLRGTAGPFHILLLCPINPQLQPYWLGIVAKKTQKTPKQQNNNNNKKPDFNCETKGCRDQRYQHRKSFLMPDEWRAGAAGTAGGGRTRPQALASRSEARGTNDGAAGGKKDSARHPRKVPRKGLCLLPICSVPPFTLPFARK